MAKDINELSKALGNLLIEEKNKTPQSPLISDAVIGYYYLDYLNKKITLEKLLELSGNEADNGESTEECERFYAILNRIEEDKSVLDEVSFIKEVLHLFEPFKMIAEKQKEELKQY